MERENASSTRGDHVLRRDGRGVSTVIDVAFALLFVSASVLMLGVYLHTPDTDIDEDAAEHTAQIMAESTISVQYSLADVEPVADRGGEYHQTDYGTPTGLLTDAAMTNVQIDDTQPYAHGADYEDAVDASIGSAFVGSNHNVYVVAEWRPYENAEISGVATAGQYPPSDADISSVTTSASSGIQPADEDEIRDAYLESGTWWEDLLSGFDSDTFDSETNQSLQAVGTVVGVNIIEAYFPERSTQLALENAGISHDLTVHAYEQWVEPLEYSFSGNDNPDTHGPLLRSEANATEANQKVLHGYDGDTLLGNGGLGQWLGYDLYAAYEDEIDAIEDRYADDDDRDEAIADLLAEEISLEDVQITIQTWHQ